ncbi:MAG TPA: DUF4911 domain-containing protein [Syntrophales bacterium]|nr:DUF4911 domain-containing protein [Syntrophales bacterium]HON23213.1 DUF4911 domain-containing protein [Syntrophales bacterium]HOU76661.1 DUF4911 domain-containing protein [Syntrophales bacterium]HPC31418.1 DUF4911 domain-containing protein [Syntrophales bacterium]HQG33324.1 DUF4911 domain-containing protein [Syntrophales bacterium]
MKMLDINLQLSRPDLVVFQFLLEGYDRVASITTIDAGEGRVRISFPPESREEVERILAALAKTVAFRRFV